MTGPGAWPGRRTGVQGRGRGVRQRRDADWGRNSIAWRRRLPKRTRKSSFAATRAGSPPSALSSSSPDAAHARYQEGRRRLGRDRHFQAKEEEARQFGHGVLDADLMREAPGFGTTLVGLETVRKDTAQVVDVPLPPSMSGDSVHRAMAVTLAWFSPMESSLARYRLAALGAVAGDAPPRRWPSTRLPQGVPTPTTFRRERSPRGS